MYGQNNYILKSQSPILFPNFTRYRLLTQEEYFIGLLCQRFDTVDVSFCFDSSAPAAAQTITSHMGDHSNLGADYAPRHAQFALPQDNSCCTSQTDSPPGRFRLRFGNESESTISDNIDG